MSVGRCADAVVPFNYCMLARLYPCFKDEADKERFDMVGKEGGTPHLALDDILNRFLGDLERRGRVPQGTHLESMARLDLALLILDVYIKYPLPASADAVVPFNYCMLARLYPWTESLLAPFC